MLHGRPLHIDLFYDSNLGSRIPILEFKQTSSLDSLKLFMVLWDIGSNLSAETVNW
jgi:hypothetical protein